LEEFEKTVKTAVDDNVTTVIDVMIDPEENVFPMVPPGKGLRDILVEAD
jgi:acetolactate synthase-1/2/3 large subunit